MRLTTRITTPFLLLFLALSACGEPAELDNQSNQDEQPNQQHDDDNDNSNDNQANDDNYDLPDVRDHMGPIGEDGREVEPIFPDDYDVEGDHPLLFLLHGYGSDAQETIDGFDAGEEANEYNAIRLAPEGHREDSQGMLFWNAIETCCDFEESGVDDVAYLTNLIDEAIHNYAVDPDRIYFLGISNGAMMSHRMACERGDLINSIVSFNGTSTRDAIDCLPEDPVNIYHVHGTDDDTVAYDGNTAFAGAREVVDRWARWNDCDDEPIEGPSVNVTGAVAGDETDIERWEGCTDGGDVELWTMNGAGHVPLPLADFPQLLFETIM